jgi:hypothetical protein
MTSSGRRFTLAQVALLILCMLLVLGAADIALAQPFGMTRPQAPPEVGGFAGLILAKQAELYFPRRRPRPRQGRDLVLSGRQ